MPFICGTILCCIPLDIRHHSHLNFTSALSDEQAYFRENCNPRTSQSVVIIQHDSCRIVFSIDSYLVSPHLVQLIPRHILIPRDILVLSACTCVRAAQLLNVKDRRDHRVKRGFEKEMKNHHGNGIFPADMKWRMFPAKTKYYPRNEIFPAEIKYSPRKRNVAIFPAAEKIFPAAKDIPRGPEYIPRGNECNNIPRGRENIPRGKKYSPRPRKYSPRQKILPAAQKIFPAAKNIPRGPENIPRGRENIPRGKKFSFLCPSQASVIRCVNDTWKISNSEYTKDTPYLAHLLQAWIKFD